MPPQGRVREDRKSVHALSRASPHPNPDLDQQLNHVLAVSAGLELIRLGYNTNTSDGSMQSRRYHRVAQRGPPPNFRDSSAWGAGGGRRGQDAVRRPGVIDGEHYSGKGNDGGER